LGNHPVWPVGSRLEAAARSGLAQHPGTRRPQGAGGWNLSRSPRRDL